MQTETKVKTNAKDVLIGEDDADLRRIFAEVLEHHGYKVSEAATGHEAIVTAINEKPKLILLDLSLPDMTGTEAASVLKRNPQTMNIPIVGCSAYFGPEWRDQALRSGMVGYLQKPVPLREIESVIEQFILLER
jgi:two-component system cell cycle response regulator DivK